MESARLQGDDMRSLVHAGPRDVQWREAPEPRLTHDEDVPASASHHPEAGCDASVTAQTAQVDGIAVLAQSPSPCVPLRGRGPRDPRGPAPRRSC